MKEKIFQVLFILSILSLFTFLFLKTAKAFQYNLTNPRVTLSDSSPGASNVEYKFEFTTNYQLSSGQVITLTFPNTYQSPVASSSNVFCPQNTRPSVSGRIVICTVEEGKTLPPTSTQILISGIQNPSKEAPPGVADFHFVTIETSAGEGVYFPVCIIETLKVKGKIYPILTFEISGLGIGERVHETLVTTVSTTASTIIFENIPVNTPILAAQDLSVTTNAGFGFRVEIIQNDDLKAIRDGRVFRIFCFENGRCKSLENATAWIKPEGILGDPKTYGHFGITSEDNSLGENCTFNYYGSGQGGKWVGLDIGKPTEIMRHCGPADGETRHQGKTRIGFQVEVTVLQPAGTYQTNFTYVVTPIF